MKIGMKVGKTYHFGKSQERNPRFSGRFYIYTETGEPTIRIRKALIKYGHAMAKAMSEVEIKIKKEEGGVA